MAKAPKTDTKPVEDWDAPADTGTGFTQAEDPNDAAFEEQELDEAARRAELTNMQTTKEAEEGRDAVSGTLNPGVTQAQSDAHTQPGDRGSDMAGNAPKPDPLAALDQKLVNEIHRSLTEADKQDVAAFRRPKDAEDDVVDQKRVAHERSAGWRSLSQLGVHAITLKALVKAGKVEEGTAPGMQHHGDTGKLYRIKRDRG